jgi:ribosomal protein L12E/L44/L45/RPP1/RPP2
VSIHTKILKNILLIVLLIVSGTNVIAQTKPTAAKAPTAKSTKPTTKAKPKSAKAGDKNAKKKKGKKGKEEEEDFYSSKGKKKKKGATGEDEGKVVDTKSLFKGKVNMNSRKSSGGSSANGGSLYRPLYIGKKLVTGNIVTAQGFRICIYNGTNRDSALAMKLAFMKSHKSYNSYMSYNMPYYRIKVGDWDDKKTAAKALKEISKVYPVSFIVPDAVTRKNILVYKNY